MRLNKRTVMGFTNLDRSPPPRHRFTVSRGNSAIYNVTVNPDIIARHIAYKREREINAEIYEDKKNGNE